MPDERAPPISPPRLRARYSIRVLKRIEQLLLTHLHIAAPASLQGKSLNYGIVRELVG
jgi:hypothetical protein